MTEPIRVLHVDDESDFADLAATFLEREDDRFSVETATRAGEGIDRLGNDDFDCIVSDYDMPGQNGIEFLEAVRAEHPNLPFILFTGKGSEEVASDAITAGATDYLQKQTGSEQYELLAHRIRNAVEQYRSTQRATNLDRMRTLTGDINQALVHANSREEIETRVCEIISESTPYKFAWIGEVDPETERIEPRTWAGIEAGYLDAITVATHENPAGHGPGWTAINEGRVAVSQHVQEDPEFEPWREEAIERGYRAVAAVPLEYEDHRYGVLGVYAYKPNAFDEEEQELLAELGDDIAHAVAAFETRHDLEDTRERMQLALEHTDSVLFEIDFDTGTVTRHGPFEQFYDIPSDEVSTWEAFLEQAVHPEDQERFLRFYRRLADDDRDTGTLEFRTNPETASVRWIKATAYAEGDPGDSRRVLGLAQDITARKEEEQQREQIIERVTDAIVEVDAEWQFTLVNEQAGDLYDIDAEQLLGQNFWDVFSEARGTRFEEEYRQVMDTREPTSFVEYYSGLDGWFNVQVYPNDDGGLAFYFSDITERRKRERRFEAIFNNTYTFTGLLDPDGILLEANETALSFGGLDREEVVGQPVWETYWFQSNEETRKTTREAVKQARDGDLYRDEIRVQGADDEAVIDFSVRPVTNDRGEVTVLIPEGRDITEHKEREERFAHQQSLLEAVIETSIDGILVVDEEREYVTWNQQFIDMWDVPEELIGDKPEELGLEWALDQLENPDAFIEEVEYLYEHPAEESRDQIRLTDGRVFDRYSAPVEGDDGTHFGRVWFFRDITDQKDREQGLEQLHAATRDLMTATTAEEIATIGSETATQVLDLPMNGIYLYDSDAEALVPVAWSEGDTSVFDGYPPSIPAADGLAGKAYATGNPEIYADVPEAAAVPNEGAPFRSELHLPLGEHGILLAGSTTVGDFDATDEALGQVLAANVEAALDRVEREQELKRRNEQLDEFANIVSHDLRNPLTVADGRLELAHEECESEHLDAVARSHDRMETLIDDLLTLAREGNRVENPESVGLAAISENCWRNVDTKRASLAIDTDRTIRADQSRLQQLLENLMRNAVEHGGEDVTVTIGDIDDGFYVVDDGTGIPKDKRERVVESGYSTSEDGTGLGLNIVEQIAEAHDWDIRVTDSGAGGARFEITGVEFADC